MELLLTYSEERERERQARKRARAEALLEFERAEVKYHEAHEAAHAARDEANRLTVEEDAAQSALRDRYRALRDLVAAEAGDTKF